MRSMPFLASIALISGVAAAQEPTPPPGSPSYLYCGYGAVSAQVTVERPPGSRRDRITGTIFTWTAAEPDRPGLSVDHGLSDGRRPAADPESIWIGLPATMDSMSFSRIEIVPIGSDGTRVSGAAVVTIGRDLVRARWPDRERSRLLLEGPTGAGALRQMVQAGEVRATLIETLPGRPERIVATGRINAAALDAAERAFAAFRPALERMARSLRTRCAEGGQDAPAPPD